jgi:hypothetical protein
LFEEKTRGKKSRDTVPLLTSNTVGATPLVRATGLAHALSKAFWDLKPIFFTKNVCVCILNFNIFREKHFEIYFLEVL